MLSNYYEWYRFLKNSYYNIGGYEVSLFEIENNILTQDKYTQEIYGETAKFSDSKRFLQVDDNISEGDDGTLTLTQNTLKIYRTFGITKPTQSSPSLKVYFPNTINDTLKMNACEYLSSSIKIDIEESIISLPEYLIWIDPKFRENVNVYNE